MSLNSFIFNKKIKIDLYFIINIKYLKYNIQNGN